MGYNQSIQKAKALAKLVSIYRDSYKQLYEEAVYTSKYKLFGLRSSGLDRGFYSPSLIDDIVIGNAHRGRVVKKVTNPQSISHVFYFDSGNRLSAINMVDTSKEVILQRDESELGIVFRVEGLFQITQCLFQHNQITRYERVRVFEENSDHITEYLCESYFYKDNRLSSCLMEHFLSSNPDLSVYQEYLYLFEHSPDGSESRYQIETHNELGERVEGHFDNQQYLVKNNSRLLHL